MGREMEMGWEAAREDRAVLAGFIAQDWEPCRVLVTTAINLLVAQTAGKMLSN
jgi:hypothetical protein